MRFNRDAVDQDLVSKRVVKDRECLRTQKQLTTAVWEKTKPWMHVLNPGTAQSEPSGHKPDLRLFCESVLVSYICLLRDLVALASFRYRSVSIATLSILFRKKEEISLTRKRLTIEIWSGRSKWIHSLSFILSYARRAWKMSWVDFSKDVTKCSLQKKNCLCLVFICILVSSILIYLFTLALADTKKFNYLHNYFLSEPTLLTEAVGVKWPVTEC